MDDKLRQVIIDGIRGGRKEQRLTQQELADMIGIATRTLGKIENGNCDSVAFSTVVDVLDTVDCEVIIRKRKVPDDVALHGIDLRQTFSERYGGDY